MSATVRPYRSMLYMPGSNARALEKARSLPADALILDLEDAVAPDAKPEARTQVAGAVAAGGFGRRVVLVRANALETPWGRDDLAAAATSGADGVVLPKVESPECIRQAERILAASGAPPGMGLWVMAETPLGVLNITAIAGAGGRLRGLILGTTDLSKELRCAHAPDRQPLLTALGLVLLAGRAHGLVVLDGVHVDLEDDAGLEAACAQGRRLGFDGKTLVHPKQIAAANAAFAPSADEVEQARRIIAAHAAAVAAGQGVAVVDGKLVESLHVDLARRTVAMASAIAALG